jgi:NAD(P)-dependent dehydrogenase (short-subunit alcohol dehydrogenase family)
MNISSCAGSYKRYDSLYTLKTTGDANLFQENKKRGDLSHRTAKAALNMITVDLARELVPDKISCITMSPGWVQTKMSNWTLE